jgi:hypothetical protein
MSPYGKKDNSETVVAWVGLVLIAIFVAIVLCLVYSPDWLTR